MDRAGLGARDDAPGEGRSFSVGLGLTALQMDMQSVVPSEPLAEVPVLLALLPLGLPWCRLGVFLFCSLLGQNPVLLDLLISYQLAVCFQTSKSLLLLTLYLVSLSWGFILKK